MPRVVLSLAFALAIVFALLAGLHASDAKADGPCDGTSVYSDGDPSVPRLCYVESGEDIAIVLCIGVPQQDIDGAPALCPATTTIPATIAGKPVTSIGSYAFQDWRATSAVIPDSVVSIGSNAFYSSRLTSITLPTNPGFTEIGRQAFMYTALTSIAIPSSVTTIDPTAFNQTNSLQQYTVDPASQHFSSLDGVLFDRDRTMLVSYPHGSTRTAYAVPSGVITIGDSAFSDVPGLTSISFPEGLTTIGIEAFYESSPTSITFPGSVTTIGRNAFEGMRAVTGFTFEGNAPASVGSDAFAPSCNNNDHTCLPARHFTGTTGFDLAEGDNCPGKWQCLSVVLAPFPARPPAPTATAGVESASIAVTAATIGEPPTSYTVTARPGERTCTVTGAAGTCTIKELTGGTAYTFTAVAHNADPTPSAASAASAAVTPTAVPGPAAAGTAAGTPAPEQLKTTTAPVPTNATTITTTFYAPGPGVVAQLGTTTTGRRALRAAGLKACSASKAITRAGTVTVTCRLTNAAKRARARHALRVVLVTTFTPTSGAVLTSTRTVVLARTPAHPATPAVVPSSVTG